MDNLERILYRISNKCHLSIAGAALGLAAPVAKLTGDYVFFGKTLYEQLQNPEQVFNYGLITLGAITALSAGGALVERIMDGVYTDSLTGAYNNKALRNTETEIRLKNKSARKQTEKFTIAIIDLDNFKPVNDTYGHKAGDEVLTKIVQHVFKSEMKRPGDMVFRIGGDEFMLYMPETDVEGANMIIERMRNKINHVKVGDIQMGFSVGIVADDGSTDIEELKVRADKIMYADKAMRKDDNR